MSGAGTGAQTAGAATTVTGATIDRFKIGSPMSADIAVLFDSTLGANDTLGFQLLVQHSVDGSTWATYAASALPATLSGTAAGASTAYATTGYTPSAATIPAAVGGTGGTTQQGEVSLGVDLSGADQYVRVNVAPVFSATSTDTTTFVVSGAFAGQDRLPATV
jgi:hypothetical protein